PPSTAARARLRSHSGPSGRVAALAAGPSCGAARAPARTALSSAARAQGRIAPLLGPLPATPVALVANPGAVVAHGAALVLRRVRHVVERFRGGRISSGRLGRGNRRTS